VNNLEKKFKHGGPSTLDETLDVAITSLQAVLSSDFKPDEVPVCAAGCLFIGSRVGGGGGGVTGVGGWAVGGVAGAGSVLRCVCAPPSVRPSPHVTIHFGPPPPPPQVEIAVASLSSEGSASFRKLDVAEIEHHLTRIAERD
jgi:hypothetical protein